MWEATAAFPKANASALYRNFAIETRSNPLKAEEVALRRVALSGG